MPLFTASHLPSVALALRAVFGGILMGLANLVPGISGGTMLLASGIYPAFIQGIADVSRLQFRRTSLWVVGLVAVGALGAIGVFAGPVKHAVVESRFVMYSLFIGLTLGGIPMVWQLAKPVQRTTWLGTLAGFLLMVAVVVVQHHGNQQHGVAEPGYFLLLVGGILGASAMILPGISGSYLLLVLGIYLPLLSAIESIKSGLQTSQYSAVLFPLIHVLVPVGVGVVLGIVVVSNLLRLALTHMSNWTYGLLLGFLGGSVVGLWPFQQGVAPAIGQVVRGRPLTPADLAALSPEHYPTAWYTPSIGQVLTAAGLVGVGYALTALVAKLGAARAPSTQVL